MEDPKEEEEEEEERREKRKKEKEPNGIYCIGTFSIKRQAKREEEKTVGF